MPIVTNLYGEYDVFGEYRSHVAAALIKKFADAVQSKADQVVCWGTGAPVREFIYSGDAAEAVARLLKSGYAEPLNIGTGIGTSIKELAELTARLTGFRGEIVWDTTKADGVLRKVLDVSKMESVLDWKPPTSLEAGLATDDPLVPREQGRGRRPALTLVDPRGRDGGIGRGRGPRPAIDRAVLIPGVEPR